MKVASRSTLVGGALPRACFKILAWISAHAESGNRNGRLKAGLVVKMS